MLGGASYPGDKHVEDALSRRLSGLVPRILTQENWFGGDPAAGLARRKRRLLECLAGSSIVPETTVLIGRSSGARVATLLAMQLPLLAVVCIAYPFQAPRRVLEPPRFAHLNRLAVPTLLLQGTEDIYGGADITERFALSPAVHVRLLPGISHAFDLSSDGWDRVSAMIKGFVTGRADPAVESASLFDEAYYLGQYPDVAKAVASGRLASGQAHFARHGRSRGLPHRLHALKGAFAAS